MEQIRKTLKAALSMGVFGGFVWLTTLLKLILKRTSVLNEIADWIIVIGVGFMLLGWFSAWLHGRSFDDFKR